MKKLLSLILCLILFVSLTLTLTSCNRATLETFNESTPEELYAKALQSVANMSNYMIVHEQTTTTSAFFFMKYSIHQTMTVHLDGDDFYQNIECDVEIDTVSTIKNIGETTIDLPAGAEDAQEGNWLYFK